MWKVGAILLALSLASSAWTDTREVITETIAGHTTTATLYTQGNLLRAEESESSRVSISDFGRKTQTFLDMQLRRYAEMKHPEVNALESLAQWIARPPYQSGKTVNVFYDIVDTGERQQLLGQTAKHLLIRERNVAEPGACQGSYDSHWDGWFISLTNPTRGRLEMRTHCVDKAIVHGDLKTLGLAVIETRGDLTRRIVELSHERLNPALFEVPADFKKVDILPGMPAQDTWAQRLKIDWFSLRYAVETWFN